MGWPVQVLTVGEGGAEVGIGEAAGAGGGSVFGAVEPVAAGAEPAAVELGR